MRKFKIGDFIADQLRIQRYIVVGVDEKNGAYVCVDALCGRIGLRGVLFGYREGFAYEDNYEKHTLGKTEKMVPKVADIYCEEYNLPTEWKFSFYETKDQNNGAGLCQCDEKSQ